MAPRGGAEARAVAAAAALQAAAEGWAIRLPPFDESRLDATSRATGVSPLTRMKGPCAMAEAHRVTSRYVGVRVGAEDHGESPSAVVDFVRRVAQGTALSGWSSL